MNKIFFYLKIDFLKKKNNSLIFFNDNEINHGVEGFMLTIFVNIPIEKWIMIFGEMKQKITVLPSPDRHQINDAITRFLASGGEIQKLNPSPMNRAFDAGDGSGFHL